MSARTDKTENLRYYPMLGHLCCDINNSSVPALLPFIIAEHGYTYAVAALLVFAINAVSAITQPIFGLIGDKHPKPWFMALGVMLACSGTAIIGFAQSYALMFVGAMIIGFGMAIFHPEGGRLANLAAGANKAAGVSIFSVGGNIGFTVGPLLAVACYNLLGMKGLALYLIPGVIAALLIIRRTEDFRQLGIAEKRRMTESGQADDVSGFVICATGLSFKSIASNGLLVFIPLFFVGVVGTSESFASSMTSVYALAGIAFTLIGGRLGDRYGYKRLLMATFILWVPLIVAFGSAKILWLNIVLMVLLAFANNLSFASGTVLGQQFLPQHLGTASGIIFGITTSLGGACSPLLGVLADKCGLVTVFFTIAAIALVGAVVSAFIPKKNRR